MTRVIGVKEVPYSEALEAAMLGGVLLEPSALADLRAETTPEECYLLRHRYIFEAMLAVEERGELIDILTVGEELRARGQFEGVGGDMFLAQLMAACPDPSKVGMYARKVSDKAYSRRLLKVSDDLKALALDEKAGVAEKRAKADALIEGAGGIRPEDTVSPLSELVNGYLDYVESTAGLDDELTGLATGYRDLDAVLDGLQEESLNYLAGRPGMGKTALMLCMALNIAQRGGKVYIWTGEMSKAQLTARLISIKTEVPARLVQRGMRKAGMGQKEWATIVDQSTALAGLQIYIDDRESMTPTVLKAQVQSLSRRIGGLDVIMVDYLQLMETGAGVRAENADKELKYISRKLKRGVAKVAPVICAAQLSRKVEDREDKRPRNSDLRDSGNLEQDADTILFVYRDVVYKTDTDFPNRADIIVSKNRHGEPGTVALHFEKRLTKFTDARTTTIDLSGL